MEEAVEMEIRGRGQRQLNGRRGRELEAVLLYPAQLRDITRLFSFYSRGTCLKSVSPRDPLSLSH